MRIKKIDIPKTPDDNDGLESIKMDKLGSVVLIAGKNGSGKTRILNKIFDRFSSKPQKSKLAELRTNNQRLYSSATKVCQVKISQLKVKLSIQRDTNQREKIQEEIEKAKHSLTITENRLRNDEQTWKYIETDIQSDDYTFVPFVPKSLNLQDCNKFSKNEILSSATSIDSVGINSLPEGAFAKIQVIQNRRFNVTHLETEVTDEEKKQAIADYDKLQNIIKIFLNTKIGRTIDDEATLFGFPMGQSNLSDGQKILLQFCLAIYSQEQALKDLILVLDEPENHLHPSIIIETICVTAV
jgi:ATPase subunit of ABC transporter with duplicated ATPase domains